MEERMEFEQCISARGSQDITSHQFIFLLFDRLSSISPGRADGPHFLLPLLIQMMIKS